MAKSAESKFYEDIIARQGAIIDQLNDANKTLTAALSRQYGAIHQPSEPEAEPEPLHRIVRGQANEHTLGITPGRMIVPGGAVIDRNKKPPAEGTNG